MGRDKNKPGPLTRVFIRVVNGPHGDVQSIRVARELRDLAGGRTPPKKDGGS